MRIDLRIERVGDHVPEAQIDDVESPEVVSTPTARTWWLYVWYDNELGYSCQMIRMTEEMAGVHPPSFPVA